MRIGVDVGRVLHGDGGVAVYTRRLVTALAEYGGAMEVILFDLDRGATDGRVFEASFGGLPDQVDIG